MKNSRTQEYHILTEYLLADQLNDVLTNADIMSMGSIAIFDEIRKCIEHKSESSTNFVIFVSYFATVYVDSRMKSQHKQFDKLDQVLRYLQEDKYILPILEKYNTVPYLEVICCRWLLFANLY